MPQFIDLTPRWTQILPTWLMMYRQAVKGECTDPALIKANATAEFTRMAEAADRYNDLMAWMRAQGWSGPRIESILEEARKYADKERNEVKESDDA